jgi:hypothetical protein
MDTKVDGHRLMLILRAKAFARSNLILYFITLTNAARLN